MATQFTVAVLMSFILTNIADDTCEMSNLLQNTYIGKNTLASSDSYRDNENTLLILPDAHSQDAPHFIQDKCARQSKLELPFTCFAIHSPQTWQHEEGYLSVVALEQQFSKKWQSVIQQQSLYSYDAFFDYNLGFWVQFLDKYLQQINDHSDLLTDYIGLKWIALEPIHKTFYSLIIHSPDSQITFELISYNEPDLAKYSNLREAFQFTETNEIRATFLTYTNNEYPWNREDAADIVPIKISFGCTDIAQHVEFYSNVMEAEVLYMKEQMTSSMDEGVFISYAFMQSVNDVLEIVFVERPNYYTHGVFTVDTYQQLLTETHNDRISSATCGLDRWFDNHYGFNTLKLGEDNPEHYDFMDRVLSRVIERELKYRIYFTPYQYESPAGKYWLDKYGKDGMYTLYVFDANGQTIQMLGVFFHDQFSYNVPMYNKQWCASECLDDQQMGQFDPQKVYKEDADIRLLVVDNTEKYRASSHFIGWVFLGIFGAAFIGISLRFIYRKYIKPQNANNSEYDLIGDETECLVKTPSNSGCY